MSAKIIDGKSFAAKLREEVAHKVDRLKVKGITPGLAVILVGEDPASQVYVRNKHKATVDAGMRSFEYKLPASVSEAELIQKVKELNENKEVHGILVQLPLPKAINEAHVLATIVPEKDVDGFHLINAGKLFTGNDARLVPCTPKGSMLLLRDQLPSLSGKNALVIGRSNIVGKPMAMLLLAADCTVTIAHSRTSNLPELCAHADVLVAAVGKPEFVKGAWIKPGAVVIDVGINRILDAQGKEKLVGDVEFMEASKRAAAITPVPGGVGPMTIACLLDNTVMAASAQSGVAI